jgi:uncharacterized membrane protein HdeD (DUF308 family)
MSDRDGEPTRPRVEIVSDGGRATSGSSPWRGETWGLVLAAGIVAVVFGAVVLANLWNSVRLVAVLAGLLLLFAGVLQFVIAGGAKRARMAAGVVAVVAGVALVAWPDASVKTVAVIIGMALLLSGVALVVASLAARGDGFGPVTVVGIVLAVVGLVFVVWPGPTIMLLMTLIGAAVLIAGIWAIVRALTLRRAAAGR